MVKVSIPIPVMIQFSSSVCCSTIDLGAGADSVSAAQIDTSTISGAAGRDTFWLHSATRLFTADPMQIPSTSQVPFMEQLLTSVLATKTF